MWDGWLTGEDAIRSVAKRFGFNEVADYSRSVECFCDQFGFLVRLTSAGQTLVAGDSQPSRTKSQETSPAWERLRVTETIVSLDGSDYPLSGGRDHIMLELLIAAKGDTVKGGHIEREAGSRPDRILGRLRKIAPPVAAMVEPPGKNGRGYRLRRH